MEINSPLERKDVQDKVPAVNREIRFATKFKNNNKFVFMAAY